MIPNKKYQAIMHSARELFWKHGFKRVSIEEICKESNTSKMTFYKFFPNKIELAKKILDRVVREGVAAMHEIQNNDMPVPEKMAAIMKLKFEGSNNISEEFIKDLYTNPESELTQYMGQKTQEMLSELRGFYEQGKKDGWVRKDLDVDFMLSFSMKSISIITDDEMSHLFSSPQDMILELTRLFVYGISPKE